MTWGHAGSEYLAEPLSFKSPICSYFPTSVRVRHPASPDGDRDQPSRSGQTHGDLEARYLGEIFDRPFPEPLPRWQDADGGDLWVTRDETREQIVGFYRRAWEHADATITELPIDALGHVPWWPRPDVKLFTVMVHVLQDTTRHAGHADILREQLDGRTGVMAEYEEQIDTAARATHWAKIERAAQAAAGDAGHAGLSATRGAVETEP
ncbi:hypothetical protein GCM10023170_084560 [Phytohabitans houttuyneae]